MRGLPRAFVAFFAACAAASPAWADQVADIRMVGSTIARPAGRFWLDQDLALTVSDPGDSWPRLHAEIGVEAGRVGVEAAYTDIGTRGLSLRLGLYRLPLGRSNAVGIGDAALASRPLIFEDASAVPLAGAGALANLTLGGLSLSGGVTHGDAPFFGGGQVAVLRGVWLTEMPGGLSVEAGASAATNQLATVGGGDLSIVWHGPDDLGILVGAEGLAGWGTWYPRAGFEAGGYGLAAAGWGSHELAFRYDMAGLPALLGVPGSSPARTGLAAAYGLRVGPRSVLRFELGSRTHESSYVPRVPVDRFLVQLIFALGAASPERAGDAAPSATITRLP